MSRFGMYLGEVGNLSGSWMGSGVVGGHPMGIEVGEGEWEVY
jgi:hypothetical protein